MKLNIEYVDIEEIKPYENNAKVHTDEQVEQIKESIKEFGMNDPIAVWNGTIVEGHGRLMALQELGVEKVPIIRLDFLTDEQRRAYTLIHNKLTMNTSFELETLAKELSEITDYNMGEFGFNDFEEGFFGAADGYDDDIENMTGDNGLVAFNVTIKCETEIEKDWLAEALGETGRLKRLYSVSELV